MIADSDWNNLKAPYVWKQCCILVTPWGCSVNSTNNKSHFCKYQSLRDYITEQELYYNLTLYHSHVYIVKFTVMLYVMLWWLHMVNNLHFIRNAFSDYITVAILFIELTQHKITLDIIYIKHLKCLFQSQSTIFFMRKIQCILVYFFIINYSFQVYIQVQALFNALHRQTSWNIVLLHHSHSQALNNLQTAF